MSWHTQWTLLYLLLVAFNKCPCAKLLSSYNTYYTGSMIMIIVSFWWVCYILTFSDWELKYCNGPRGLEPCLPIFDWIAGNPLLAAYVIRTHRREGSLDKCCPNSKATCQHIRFGRLQGVWDISFKGLTTLVTFDEVFWQTRKCLTMDIE